MSRVRPRVLEFDVEIDRDRAAWNGRSGRSIPRGEGWEAEHLVLAALVRCTLTSLEYHARRAGAAIVGSGAAHGVVTKRESDGRYAFVEIDGRFEVQLEGELEAGAVRELLDNAERDCFVGNSLTAAPRYRWIVNGTRVE